jgi:hypothetical protein
MKGIVGLAVLHFFKSSLYPTETHLHSPSCCNCRPDGDRKPKRDSGETPVSPAGIVSFELAGSLERVRHILIAWGQWAAASFDAIENIALLGLLFGYP